MNKIRAWSQLAGAFGAALGIVSANFLTKWLTDKQMPTWFMVVSSLVLVAGSFFILERSFLFLMNRSQRFRRLLFGNTSVEGPWADIVRKGDAIISVGIIYFYFVDEEIKLNAEIFAANGLSIGSLSTSFSLFSWPVYRYQYSINRPGENVLPNGGFGYMKFEPRSGPPKLCNGYFFDQLRSYRCDFSGWRLEDEADINLLDSHQGRSEFVRAAVERELLSRPQLTVAERYPESEQTE